MAIIYKNDDLFSMLDKVDVLVNTVNCYGIMGKGIALYFKSKFPKMYKEYKQMCDDKLLRPGAMHWYSMPSDNKDYISEDLFSAPIKQTNYILNFPTKDHWRANSKISYIEDGLTALIKDLQTSHTDIKSIAMPPLGCGNGGLDWAIVKPLIEKAFQQLPHIELFLFEPQESISEPQPFYNAQ